MKIRVMQMDVRKGSVKPGAPEREFLSAFVVDTVNDNRSLSLAMACESDAAKALVAANDAEEAAQAEAAKNNVKRGAYVPVFDLQGFREEASVETAADGSTHPVTDRQGRACYNLRPGPGATMTFIGWEPRSHQIAVSGVVPPPPPA